MDYNPAVGHCPETNHDKRFLQMRRFVLLDRDGTINVDRDYLADPAELEFIPGASAALARLARLGLGLAVITNQSGVGRGLIRPAQLTAVHQRLGELLAAEGVRLDGIYACPHLPGDGCRCRKPNIGLVQQAAAELGFDPARSFVVGDKASDIELGQRVGAVTLLVRTGYGAQHERNQQFVADYVVDDLAAAADVIQSLLGSMLDDQSSS
ncbi:MAG TPA: D-glycero-beta-D-manno-heptose 1,7-bisphosphate 7-phosphatase [Pirellulales bacterium]|jgi:D-glycero-D-manno-heptose 1,7-bisphosphate phosphatase|nr:D-glycero-beta-D-manno-heptose 1,7-bisphosphate 7-phosphatase [Pirellulales bacterium]